MVTLSDETLIEQSRRWVSSVVVGLNFCPFAKPVIESGDVDYKVINERSLEQCLMALSGEFKRLTENNQIETSLLICPHGFESFDDYLDLLAVANSLLLDEGYEGVFQLASFHPDYCFDGLKQDDAANYTNRSPYPILHILREKSVERALNSVSNPEKIPARNEKVAREKGLEEMKALLGLCKG
ncbi:MAG: hypothetical protein A6F72_02890 [Cycloclasticus sp. symbiont of Poecilosclerida sp. N]|nr:MAG: hypothetical protein A6F72_02890 [Cycloclasticus sp. symbiont of Poecilosclerida sp. N]